LRGVRSDPEQNGRHGQGVDGGREGAEEGDEEGPQGLVEARGWVDEEGGPGEREGKEEEGG